MSGRLIATAGRLPAMRSATARAVRQYHQLPSGGLLRADAAIRATRRRMWFPVNCFHNAVAVRNASFARFLPRLVVKFIRIPALAGGFMVGGLAWIQYQATRMSPDSPTRVPYWAANCTAIQRLGTMPGTSSIPPRRQCSARRQVYSMARRVLPTRRCVDGRTRRIKWEYPNGCRRY